MPQDDVPIGKKLNELVKASSEVLGLLDLLVILRQTLGVVHAVPHPEVTRVYDRGRAYSDPGRKPLDRLDRVSDPASGSDQTKLSEKIRNALEEQESTLGASSERLRSALQALADAKLAGNAAANTKSNRKGGKTRNQKSIKGAALQDTQDKSEPVPEFPPLLIEYYNAAAQVRFLTEELVELDYAHDEDAAGRQLRVDQDESLSVTDSIFEQKYREQRTMAEEGLNAAILEADHLKARCLEEGIDIEAGLDRQHESDLDSEEALRMDLSYSDSEPAPLPQQIKMMPGRLLPGSKAQLPADFWDALTKADSERPSAQEKSPFNVSEWIQDVEPTGISIEPNITCMDSDSSPEPSYSLAPSYVYHPRSDQDNEEQGAPEEAYPARIEGPYSDDLHHGSSTIHGYPLPSASSNLENQPDLTSSDAAWEKPPGEGPYEPP